MTRTRLVLALFALVLVASGAIVLLALTRPDGSDAGARPTLVDGRYRPAELDGPGGTSLETAASTAGLVLTYDYRHLGAGLREATETMTPAFARTFRRTFLRTSAPVARRREAVTRGVVRGAGLVRADGETRATCLVYVDQQLASSTRSDPAAEPVVLSRSRVRVDLVRRDGRWLVDGIDPV